MAAQLEAALLRDLRQILPQNQNTDFVLAAHLADKLVGGLVAETRYGWLHIHVLWVSQSQRGLGIGRDLMQHGEAKAKTLGCHGAWLDTTNPDAKDFYLHLGYEVFGILENTPNQQPPTHKRWMLRKQL